MALIKMLVYNLENAKKEQVGGAVDLIGDCDADWASFSKQFAAHCACCILYCSKLVYV
jgi:hypothetical protein